MSGLLADDPLDVRLALRAPAALAPFAQAGVLAAADVHVAVRLGQLGGEDDPEVLLAAALAVRGPRLGHVYVDLEAVRETTVVELEEPVDLAALPWPDPAGWLPRVAASGLVAHGEEAPQGRPLRLLGARLYLDRHWREERQVAEDLRALAVPEPVDTARLADGLGRLFGVAEEQDLQRLAAATAVLRRLAVVAGGAGTGKTTIVARIIALLCEQAGRPPLVALAAPTAKAADRLQEAVQAEGVRLDTTEAARATLRGLEASTLHRLLGWRRGSHSRFRHHRGNRLPHDVVVVDETSMVPLWMMARLTEAVRGGARLILIGDPGQLASIEAGAVLGDLVGPAAAGLLLSRAARERLTEATTRLVDAGEPPEGAVLADSTVVLDRIHRFGGGIAELAATVRDGDPDEVLGVLSRGAGGVTWAGDVPDLARERAVEAGRAVHAAAVQGREADALDALGRFRLLCAHRGGPYGAATWVAEVERWLAEAIDGYAADGRWYAGRPLLVTRNDYALKLFNGDTGVVVAGDRAVFRRRGELQRFAPSRLEAVETVHATTVHKAQGSQFDTAVVLLPDAGSRLLTRELLYTAVTRARRELVLIGSEEAIRLAVARPIARASGLRGRLWGSAA